MSAVSDTGLPRFTFGLAKLFAKLVDGLACLIELVDREVVELARSYVEVMSDV
jgi:hypothetical protein